MNKDSLQFLWRDAQAAAGFQTGVSLHSHTMNSRETLGFIPRYAAAVPFLSMELERLQRRYQKCRGHRMDFTTAYWTPPLPAREAYEVERRQIEDGLDLSASVSLSDHDNIDAGVHLQVVERNVPISVEWSIPYETTYFHLGIHNLPAAGARETMSALAAYTARPSKERLAEILAGLDDEPGVLIVLNHPMWDQAAIGMAQHQETLGRLIEQVGHRIHAVELNGLRPWDENRKVAEMARALGRTLISGGDRHGREPNAIVNLTNAATFAEFVEEVRDGSSHVLFLPQYREPLRLRILQTLCEVMSECPDLPGREQWTDRVFYERRPGLDLPISADWKTGGPWVVRWFVRGVSTAGASRRLQRALRLWLLEDQEFAVY